MTNWIVWTRVHETLSFKLLCKLALMYIAGKASKNHYKQVEVVSWWADQASCFDYDYY